MWWSEAEWDALTDPVTCGMCADAHLGENEHSNLVISTSTTHVRLARNQAHPGYCLVILKEHVTDLGDLDPATLSEFWLDVQRAGRAIAKVYEPCKIDYLVMGHRMPHLHCHVFPQHSTDDPTRNVDISEGLVLLSSNEMNDAVQSVQRVWAELAT